MAEPDGNCKDTYRVMVSADEFGQYRFESHFAPSYARRPSHIHVRVTADGFKARVAEHYPEAGSSRGEFDLVLISN
jgi:protocatechuate 3,4-dioxygenase beta subunit